MPCLDRLIEELENFTTPTLSNAIDRLGIRNPTEGFSNSKIRCLFPQLGIRIGVAMTAEIETMNPQGNNAGLGPLFFELLEIIEAEQSPVIVVAKEVGKGNTPAAHCGEVIATTLKRVGAVGIVTDGAVRDISEVRNLGFQFYATGIVPSSGNARLVRIGGSVQVGGIEVNPGDLLHGDENGLIKIPVDGREKLAALAAEVSKGERAVLKFLRSNRFSLEGLKELIIG